MMMYVTHLIKVVLIIYQVGMLAILCKYGNHEAVKLFLESERVETFSNEVILSSIALRINALIEF